MCLLKVWILSPDYGYVSASLVFCLTGSSPGYGQGAGAASRSRSVYQHSGSALARLSPVMPNISLFQLSCCTFKVSSFPLVSCDLSYESHDSGSCDQL